MSTQLRLKRLYVSARYASFVGGTETRTREDASRMVVHGHDVTVLTSGPAGDLLPRGQSDGITIRRVGAWLNGHDYHLAPGLYREIGRGDWNVRSAPGLSHTRGSPYQRWWRCCRGFPTLSCFTVVATRQGSAPTLVVCSGDSSARSSPALVFSLLSGYVPPARVYVSPFAGFAKSRTVIRNPPSLRRSRRRWRWWSRTGCRTSRSLGDADRAHAVAYFLLPFAVLPFVRTIIAGPTPHHLFDAPGAGKGKGLLQSELSSPAVGPVGDDDEGLKLITSMLRQGRSHFVLGNVSRVMDSMALSEAMTAPV